MIVPDWSHRQRALLVLAEVVISLMPGIPVSFESATEFSPVEVLLFLNLTIATITQLHIVFVDQVLEEKVTHTIAMRAPEGLRHLSLSHSHQSLRIHQKSVMVNYSAKNFTQTWFHSR